MEMTLPVWISFAASLVTAAVVRLVAPTWSSGPKGDAFTRALQSLWARAAPVPATSPHAETTRTAMALIFMSGLPGLAGHCARGLAAATMPKRGPVGNLQSDAG